MADPIPPNLFEGRDPHTPPPSSKSITEILSLARTHLHRLSPQTAHTVLSLLSPPSILVDIRPSAQRALEGTIPYAIIIERNVLEWRLDPRSGSDTALDWEGLGIGDKGGRWDLRVIVICSEGYTSSLAAASLGELGLGNATDVIGGFRAWREAGLPVVGGGFFG